MSRSSIWRRCARFESGGELQFFPSPLPLVGSGGQDGKGTRLLETESSSFPDLAKILSSILANGNGKGNVLLSASHLLREIPGHCGGCNMGVILKVNLFWRWKLYMAREMQV